MKIAKWPLLLVVTSVIVGGVACVITAERRSARSAASQVGPVAKAGLTQAMSKDPSVAVRPKHDVVSQSATTPPEIPEPLEPVKLGGQTNTPPQAAVAQVNQGGPPAKEPLRDPMAREVLAWVGADAAAEAYWYGAINDPSLPPGERQDLIEDLNEDGLSDPKNPTADDLPLIVSRLWLIEDVGMEAMDTVNADAFAEAYKDLINLAKRAMGGGEPVR